MSIYEKYELLGVTVDGPIKTFAARQAHGGREVAIHLLLGAASQHRSLLDKVRNLPESSRSEILEIGEHEGTAYVVTTPWKRMVGLAEWVAASTPAAAAPPPLPTRPSSDDKFRKAASWRIPVSEFGRKMEPPTGSPAPPEPKIPPSPAEPHQPTPEPPAPITSGEFTRMFEAAKPTASTPGAGGEAAGEFTRMFEAQNPSAAAAANPPKQNEPGEFTRMFQTPAAQPPPLSPPASGGRGPISDKFQRVVQPDVASESDDFLRRFQQVSPSAPTEVHPVMSAKAPAPEPPAPQRNEPGEFTRMFQTPAASGTRGAGSISDIFESPPAAPPQSPPAPQKNEPGEFTRMFQTPAASTPAPTPATQPPVGEFTKTFQVPSMQAAPPPPPPQAKQDAGEFTRMFQVPAGAPPTAPASPQAPNDRGFITPDRGGRPAEAPKSGPGEFTRMFETPGSSPTPPAAPPAPVPPRPAAQQQGPGEFTRMFQTPASTQTPQAPPPPAPPTSKAAGPGEFTRFFQAPQHTNTPAAHPAYKDPFAKAAEPTAPESGVGEFTRMFGTPVVSANPMPHAQPPIQQSPMAAPPQAVPQQQGPGEFTRMFATPAAPQPMNTPKPAAAHQAAPTRTVKKKTNYLPLIVLGALLFIAILVILILALKK